MVDRDAAPRRLPGAHRMRLSPLAELRALSGLAADHQPEAAGLWHQIGRSWTLIELDNIEIIEATVKVENEATINLDEDISRRLYALCWERFEKALINANALYNETTSEGQQFEFNRVKRLLWEVDDLKRNIDAIFHMTALPEEITEDEAFDRDA